MRPGIFRYFMVAMLLLPGVTSFAGLTVSPIFSANMVLQRGMSVPVFGTGNPGETVFVSFNGQTKYAVPGANGAWRTDLDAMPANSSGGELAVRQGSAVLTFTGVQVGEVWVCSGQSNMGFPLSNADEGAAAIADAGNHNIRLFRMIAGNGPSSTTWKVAGPGTAGNFSAVGYWMGLELSRFFGDVPIGLIQATHDGTAISAWQHTSGGTGVDYDAMIRSIQPFAVKGVAWYQGESNGGDALYAGKLTNMIREWRAGWGQSGLPFGIIQLAYRSGWNVCRNAQLEVADSEPNCFLVVIRDLPGGALHPTVKKPVGIRTAIGARGLVYGENITWSAPIRDVPTCYVTGNKVILNWKHIGNGLFTSDGKAPGEFRVATAAGQFKTAVAKIVGNTVEVASTSVANPARVQYAYSGVGNLYNRVSVETPGEVTVDRLKVSEFQINVQAQPVSAMAKSAVLTAGSLQDAGIQGVNIFPNPALNGHFFIGLEAAGLNAGIQIRICDLQGRVVFRKTLPATPMLEVSGNLQPGTYLLMVESDAQLLASRKLIVP